MKAIALRIGLEPDPSVQDFRVRLAALVNEHASLAQAASHLDLDQSTLSKWCLELDIDLQVSRTTVAHTVAVLAENSRPAA